MAGVLLQGLFIVLLWVGLWGITEMAIDKIAQDNKLTRLIIYFILIILSIFFLWILDITLF